MAIGETGELVVWKGGKRSDGNDGARQPGLNQPADDTILPFDPLCVALGSSCRSRSLPTKTVREWTWTGVTAWQVFLPWSERTYIWLLYWLEALAHFGRLLGGPLVESVQLCLRRWPPQCPSHKHVRPYSNSFPEHYPSDFVSEEELDCHDTSPNSMVGKGTFWSKDIL